MDGELGMFRILANGMSIHMKYNHEIDNVWYSDWPTEIDLDPTLSGKGEKGLELVPESPEFLSPRATTVGGSGEPSHPPLLGR